MHKIFRKTNIFYSHDTDTYVWVAWGKIVSFSENFAYALNDSHDPESNKITMKNDVNISNNSKNVEN